MIDKITCLKEEITALKEALLLQTKRAEEYAKAYHLADHLLRELKRHRFGTRSEKHIPTAQQSLFDAVDVINAPKADDEKENDIQVPAHARSKNKKLKNEPKKRIVIVSVDEEKRQCACGCMKALVRYESCYYYHLVPAVSELIEERREILACSKGCANSICTAPKPAHVLPKIKASHALLAHIIVSKVIDRQPLYHLEKQFSQRYGMLLSRRCMSDWLIRLAPQLQPLLNLFKDTLLEYDIASLDATFLQVLKEPGRAPQTKSYAYCIRGGPPDKKIVLYDYNANDHKSFVLDMFAGFEGVIHADADPFFERLAASPEVSMSYCNAHARRKFEGIAKAVTTPGIAHHAMQVYRTLYQIERQAKKKGLSAKARYELRLEKAKPILLEFKQWLHDIYPTLLPKSPLCKAVDYVINHWPGLIKYLDDGRLEFDNNLTEQEIKMFVILRKNFLFADTIAGAKALLCHVGLLRTAIANGLEPYHYLKAVLDALPHCQTVEDYEALLPWRIKTDVQESDQRAA
jgi:transposase